MYFEEPRVEIVNIDVENPIVTSPPGAAEDICAPGSGNDTDFPCYDSEETGAGEGD